MVSGGPNLAAAGRAMVALPTTAVSRGSEQEGGRGSVGCSAFYHATMTHCVALPSVGTVDYVGSSGCHGADPSALSRSGPRVG